MPTLTRRELDHFFEELAGIVRAGCSVPEGLRQVSTSVSSKGNVAKLAGEVAVRVEQGLSLADAVAQCGFRVPPEFVATLQCAEISGKPGSILDGVVANSRRLHRHTEAIMTAAMYPAYLVVACLMIMWFISNFAISYFTQIYHQAGLELSLITRAVLSTGTFLRGTFGHIAIGALVFGILYVLHHPRHREWVVRALSVMLGSTRLIRMSDLALTMRFLSDMLSRAVPLPTALRACGLAVTHPASRHQLDRMAKAADQGAPLTPHLSLGTPTTAAFLFRQGEERGTLAAACDGIASYCEDIFERHSQRAASLAEPVLIIFVSIFLGSVVIALYAPLFNIPKALN